MLAVSLAVSVLFTGASASRLMLMWGATFDEYDTFFIMLNELPGQSIWDDPIFWGGPHSEDMEHIDYVIDNATEEELERIGVEREWLQLRLNSGLYYNTDPPVNIFYTDRYFFEAQIFFTADGRHFVVILDFPSTFGPEYYFYFEVVRFFAYGVQVSSYRVSDLIENRDSLGGRYFGVPWMEDSIERSQHTGTLVHNQHAGTLSLETIEGRRFTFDITTGEKISGDATNVNWNPPTGA